MTKIKKLVHQIDDELCSAKHYAEKYLSYKAEGDNSWASKYKQMANEELNHANIIHEEAVEEIKKLRTVYTPPQTMLDKWEKSHGVYLEETAKVKMYLGM